MKRFITAALLASLAIITLSAPTMAAEKPVKILWSHYTGWEVWQYLADSGILDDYGKMYGVKFEVELIPDYMKSVALYAAGQADGVAVTDMDIIPAIAKTGRDTTVLITGDYSNGNDAVVTHGNDLCSLDGKEVLIVQPSVSNYLFDRGYETVCKRNSNKVEFVNSDSDVAIQAAFLNNPNVAAVTWKPVLMTLQSQPKVKTVFDSSGIPGEILDLLVVRTDLSDGAKKAITGAWFKATQTMSGTGPEADKAIEMMAASAGNTVPEFRAQLKTTALFYTPASSAEFVKGKQVQQTMDFVRKYIADHGWTKSEDVIGIEFPDGTVLGNKQKVKLRFNASYTDIAAENKP